MRIAAIIGLLLVIALVSLSAYLRLEHSGIGCVPWPECYGNIGTASENTGVAEAYQRLLHDARQPMSWARPAHRLVASILGLLVLGITIGSIQRRQFRLLSFLLLGLTVWLAGLGIYSEGLHSPGVVMGNLAGGFLMLGLFGWLVLRLSVKPLANVPASVKRWASAALIIGCLQILAGGLTSANFAASACTTLPDCHGDWLPGGAIAGALDIGRSIEINDAGFAIGGAERAAMHQFHRLLAVVTMLVIFMAAVVSSRFSKELLLAAIVVPGIVIAEFAVGIAAVLTNIPIVIAVAHNWLAGLLLLGLLYQRAKLL